MKTTVKVYLKDKQGNKDWFVTLINLPEQEAHENYIGKWFNMGREMDHMMKCWKVETLKVEKQYFLSILFEKQIKYSIFETEIRENSEIEGMAE